MKRMTLGLIAMLLLFGMLVPSAGAETKYQLNYFELTLPDGWKYRDNGYEIQTINGFQRVVLFEYKTDFSSRPTLDDIVAALKKTLNLDEDYPDWEEVSINGQQTAVVALHYEGRQDSYVALFYDLAGYTCYAVYYNSAPGAGKAGLLALLKGLHYRTLDDRSYFRYGNAEVKYGGYKVRSVGGKTYLLADFKWRNVGTAAEVFVVNVDVTAYQDGIELQSGYIFGLNTETGTKIMPGKEITVTEVFTLRKQTGTITMIVDKLLDFDDEWPDRKYEFQLK